ncbi:MAG: site-specific DNA-methyltransferase [Nitrososphaera sp.]
MAINGKPRKIDYDEWSKPELIREIKKLEKRKKYGIVWDEERTKEIFEEEVQHKLPVLSEIKSKEIKSEQNQPFNILIEGDNYHSISVLNYTHKGKIDVIYIDPPYNTGNEGFIFNDKLVDAEDSYRHSKWLSFISKRLRLAKSLLKETGVIFISIDDNEYAQLKLLCDEIFGEVNYLVTFYIQVRYQGKTLVEDSDFQKLIECVLVYRRTPKAKLNREKIDYSFDKFVWKIKENGKPQTLHIGGKKVEIFKKGDYEILEEKSSKHNLKEIWASGKILDGNSSGRFFRDCLIPRQSIDDLGTLYKVYGIGEDVYEYRYFTGPKKHGATKGKYYQGVPKEIFESVETKQKTLPIINFLNFADSFGNCRLEGGMDFRSGKKPIMFLQHLLNLGIIEGKNNLILDFFAGSGSTGHAVLELNKKLDSNHKFILCTDNENNICTEKCYPRLVNVIKGNSKNSGQNGLGGNLKYFKTEFVGWEPTDKNKKDLVQKSTEMLCLKEDCFELVKEGEQFKIFKNHEDRYLGIIYYFDGIEPFKKEVTKLNKKINTYVFSLSDIIDEDEFQEVDHLVNLKPIPASILNVYRRIFAYVQTKKLPREIRSGTNG